MLLPSGESSEQEADDDLERFIKYLRTESMYSVRPDYLEAVNAHACDSP